MSDYKKTNDLTEKTTPVDADLLRLDDSADSFAWKKATIANVSTKVQADLIANSTNYNALAILMKGYKEYTFAIRQSETDAPVLYLIKDDFGVTPLVASYIGPGEYKINISSLSLTFENMLNVFVSNSVTYSFEGAMLTIVEILSLDEISIRTTDINDTHLNHILTDCAGVTISIRETLEDT